MKNVLVTGGTGFVGSNLSEHLLHLGCDVRILRRENSDLRAINGVDVEHCIGNVGDINSLRNAMRGCDTVFHTAAMVTFSRRRKDEQHDVNVIGTRNVVEACIKCGVDTLVHTSSVAAIGYPEPGQLATEETAFNWGEASGYKRSKLLAEREVLAGVRRGLRAVMVNPSPIVGERDLHLHGGQLVRDMKKGRVLFYIDGGMSIVYVGDVVTGHIHAAERGRTGERYILCGENLTHREIFLRTAKLVGGRPPIAKLPIPLLRLGARAIESTAGILGREPWLSSDLVAGAGRFNWFSCEKARRELDYKITSFDTAILAAYRWYKENDFL